MYMQHIAMPSRMIGRHGIWMPALRAAASEGGATSADLPNRLGPMSSAAARLASPAMANAVPRLSPSFPAAAFHRPPRIHAALQKP
jgi:hypothetical protein